MSNEGLLIDRIVRKMTVSFDGGCWLWHGARNPYARLVWRGHHLLVHRTLYEYVRGEIPEGLVLDHLCRTPNCINPWHLEAVTNGENVLRGIGITAKNVVKEQCPSGHVYSPANTAPGGKSGDGRRCRACHRIHQSAYMKRKKSA